MVCAACARTLIPGLAGITRSTWRALLRFVKSIGANNNKRDQVVLSFDDEDEHRSRRRPPSWHAMPESDTKVRQQHLSLPSLEDRTPWTGLVGPMAKGTPRAMKTIIPLVSFSVALNKANSAEKAKRARKEDMPCTQTMTASQPRKTDDEDEEEEKVELYMPGSFGYGDHDRCGQSFRCCRCAREFVVAGAAEMVVPTTPFASNFFVLIFVFPICRCLPFRSQPVPLLWCCLVLFFFSAQFGFDCTVHMARCSPRRYHKLYHRRSSCSSGDLVLL